MKIPKSIRVFDVEYPIKYFDATDEVGLTGKEDCAFLWDVRDNVIRIHHGKRSWKAVTQSLWNVALEIICKHMIIEFGQREETIIERLAVGLNTVMFLIEDEKKGIKLVDETEGK